MKFITTADLAQTLGLQPQTLRAAVCREGGYFGIKPNRLPNGRLLWPHNTLELLTSTTAARSKR